MGSQNLTDNAESIHGELSEWAISVGSYPKLTPAEIAFEMVYLGKHVRVSTVGRVRDAGFDVIPDREEGKVHALLRLPGPPAEPMWEDLRACFGEPMPNPGYTHGKGGT